MATTDLQKLVVSLEAKIDKFEKAMAKAEGIAKRSTKNIEGSFARLETALKGWAAGLSFAGMASFAQNAIKSLADIADAAKRTGADVEKLQKLLFAASQSGVSQEALISALSKLNVELGEAATKGNDLGKILKANGIELSKLKGDPVEALKLIANLMKDTQDQQARALLGQAAFGKGWAEIIPLLLEGGQGIDTLGRKAEELGIIMDKELIAKADELDDKFDAMWKSFESEGKRRILTTAKELEQLEDFATKFFNAFRQFRDPHMTGAGEEIPFVTLPTTHPPGGLRPRTPVVIPKELSPEEKEAIRKRQAEIERLQREAERRAEEQQKQDAEEERKLLEEEQRKQIEAMDDARDATKGFFSDLLSGLREGKSATEALTGAFQNLIDKLADKALDQLVNMLMGEPGTMFPWLKPAFPAGGPVPKPGGGGGGGLRVLHPPNPRVGTGGETAVTGGGILPTPFGTYPKYSTYIHDAAQRYGIDPDVLAGLIKRESGFNPLAEASGSTAKGLTQMTAATRREMGVTNWMDPQQSIYGGAGYLRRMIDQTGSLKGGLSAYYQGLGNFRQYGFAGKPGLDPTAPEYVSGVLENAQKYAQSVQQVSQTAQQAAQGFAPAFPSALQSILSAVSSMGGGFGGMFAMGGEHGGPLGMASVPSVSAMTAGGDMAGMGSMGVRVYPSKYFDVHVSRIAARGDVRTFNAMRKASPDVTARFNKLGTT